MAKTTKADVRGSLSPEESPLLPRTSPRLLLRDFVPEDFWDVHAYTSDPEVTRWLPWGPCTEVETQELLDRAAGYRVPDPRTDYSLAIVERSSGRVIGSGSLFTRQAKAGELEIGYCLARQAWGKGLAKAAAAGLLGLAFQGLGMHRVFGLVDPENPASVGVLEGLGFRQEGRLKKHTNLKGQWRDSLLFAILEEEWLASPHSEGWGQE